MFESVYDLTMKGEPPRFESRSSYHNSISPRSLAAIGKTVCSASPVAIFLWAQDWNDYEKKLLRKVAEMVTTNSPPQIPMRFCLPLVVHKNFSNNVARMPVAVATFLRPLATGKHTIDFRSRSFPVIAFRNWINNLFQKQRRTIVAQEFTKRKKSAVEGFFPL